MLSVNTRNIIKATVPVLEQHGVTITKTFYKNMLAENPSLLNVFNKVNQQKGRQPTALAMTVLAAAKNIDDLSVLLPAVNQIGHKHRALQIQPEQYDIVGKYLLLAIKEVLGTAATPEIVGAWAEASLQGYSWNLHRCGKQPVQTGFLGFMETICCDGEEVRLGRSC